eukprot:3346453-Amphidinium_carterae.1
MIYDSRDHSNVLPLLQTDSTRFDLWLRCHVQGVFSKDDSKDNNNRQTCETLDDMGKDSRMNLHDKNF